MKRIRILKRLPLDCWCGVIDYFDCRNDLLSLFYSIKILKEHVSIINPSCTKNVEFFLFTQPTTKVLFVTNLRIEGSELEKFMEKSLLFQFLTNYFPNLLRLSYGQGMYSRKIRLQVPDNFTLQIRELELSFSETNLSAFKSLRKLKLCKLKSKDGKVMEDVNQYGISGVEELVLGELTNNRLGLDGKDGIYYYRSIKRISGLHNLKILKLFASGAEYYLRQFHHGNMNNIPKTLHILTIQNLPNLSYLHITCTSLIDPEEGIFRVEGKFPSLKTFFVGIPKNSLKKNSFAIFTLFDMKARNVSISEFHHENYPLLEHLELDQSYIHSVTSREKFLCDHKQTLDPNSKNEEEEDDDFIIDGLQNLRILRMDSAYTGVGYVFIKQIRNCPNVKILDVDHLNITKCDTVFPLVKYLDLNEKNICNPDDHNDIYEFMLGDPPIQRYNLDGTFDTSEKFNSIFPNLLNLGFGFERKFDSIETFIIKNHSSVKKIVLERCYNSYNYVSLLRIEGCSSLEKVDIGVFVREVVLRENPVLKHICRTGGRKSEDSYDDQDKTDSLVISDCPKLEWLELDNCEMIEFHESLFDCLRILGYRGNCVFPQKLNQCTSLEQLSVIGSPKSLQMLDNMPNLETLVIHSKLFHSLGENLNNLTHLDIVRCEKIYNIPKYSNLKYLSVQPKLFFNEFSGFPSLEEIRLEIPSVLSNFVMESGLATLTMKRLLSEFFLMKEVRFAKCPNLRIVTASNFNHLETYFNKKIRILFSKDMDTSKITLHHEKNGNGMSTWIDIMNVNKYNSEIKIIYAEFCEGCGKLKRQEGEFKFNDDKKLDSLEEECRECGTLYCCLDCKEKDWEKKHKYLCGRLETSQIESSGTCIIL